MNEVWQAVNWIDLILGLGLIAALLVGFAMGFYRQLAIIGSLLVGLVLASQFTERLAASGTFETMHARFGTTGAQCAAYCTLILVPLLIGLLSVLIFRSFFNRTLKALDSLLGGVLGLSVGGLFCGIVLLGVFHWEENWLQAPIRSSFLGSRLAEGARSVSRIFPEDYRRRVETNLQDRISSLAETPESNPEEQPGK